LGKHEKLTLIYIYITVGERRRKAFTKEEEKNNTQVKD
jgi:hypothetical protein